MDSLLNITKRVAPSQVMPDVTKIVEQTDYALLRTQIIEILGLDPSSTSISSVNTTLNLSTGTPCEIALMLMTLIKRLIFPMPPNLDDNKEMPDDVKEMLRSSYVRVSKSHSDFSRAILDYTRTSLPVLASRDDLIAHIGAMLVRLIDQQDKQK